jgi:hypothetical protein
MQLSISRLPLPVGPSQEEVTAKPSAVPAKTFLVTTFPDEA